MLSLPALMGLGSAVLATSFLSGIFGMAGGMILMGVLLLMMPVPAAMVLHGITQTASNGWRAWLWRRHIRTWIFVRYLAGSFIALGLFSILHFVPDRAVIFILLGLMPFVSLALPERMAMRADRTLGAMVCGFISTGLQLLSGVSGPALDVFFVRTGLDRREIVATKAACQILSHLSKLAYFGGVITSGQALLGLEAVALAIGLALLGTTLSRAALERLTDIQFRNWTQRLVMAIGIVYLGQGLWDLGPARELCFWCGPTPPDLEAHDS